MRINFHKIGLLTINTGEEEADLFAQIWLIFVLSIWVFLLHFSKLHKEYLHPIMYKFSKGYLDGRVECSLIEPDLCFYKLLQLPVYLLPMLKFPKLKLLTQKCLSKIPFGKLGLCCMKEYGGLGIQILREFSPCLLASWIKRYHLKQHKIWEAS